MHAYIVTTCFHSYRTALHIACASGHVEVVHFLLERKARLNLCDNQNRSALMKVIHAVGRDRIFSRKILIAHFLNLPFGCCSCAHVISVQFQAVQCQHERCVRLLLENHADPNLVDIDDNTALHLAANIPSISTAVLLLEHDANIDAQNKVTCLTWPVKLCYYMTSPMTSRF